MNSRKRRVSKVIRSVGLAALVAAIGAAWGNCQNQQPSLEDKLADEKLYNQTKIAWAGLSRGQLYVMNTDGSERKKLTSDELYCTAFAWSPDGTKIVFIHIHPHMEDTQRDPVRFPRKRDIYVVNVDGRELRKLTSRPGLYRRPVWSPDGTRIAFASYGDGTSDICTVNGDGSQEKNLTKNPPVPRDPFYPEMFVWVEEHPVWSPDGKKIAFVSRRDSNHEIYTMNADGTEQKNLTNDPASDTNPSWSPDGKKIAFMSRRNRNREIYIMNADGSGKKKLVSGDIRGYHWSPTRDKIMFLAKNRLDNLKQFMRSERLAVYVVNADGRARKRLTRDAVIDGDGAVCWSPDGTKIAFASFEWGISVMNADGSEKRRLTSDNPSADWLSWSPFMQSETKDQEYGNRFN